MNRCFRGQGDDPPQDGDEGDNVDWRQRALLAEAQAQELETLVADLLGRTQTSDRRIKQLATLVAQLRGTPIPAGDGSAFPGAEAPEEEYCPSGGDLLSRAKAVCRPSRIRRMADRFSGGRWWRPALLTTVVAGLAVAGGVAIKRHYAATAPDAAPIHMEPGAGVEAATAAAATIRPPNPSKPICTGLTKKGVQCKKNARPGKATCYLHDSQEAAMK